MESFSREDGTFYIDKNDIFYWLLIHFVTKKFYK